jgi:hypothetical protein
LIYRPFFSCSGRSRLSKAGEQWDQRYAVDDNEKDDEEFDELFYHW